VGRSARPEGGSDLPQPVEAEAALEQLLATTRAAICAMPRVEERLAAFICHLAGRRGHVAPDAVN
jgi:hypothetical protein